MRVKAFSWMTSQVALIKIQKLNRLPVGLPYWVEIARLWASITLWQRKSLSWVRLPSTLSMIIGSSEAYIKPSRRGTIIKRRTGAQSLMPKGALLPSKSLSCRRRLSVASRWLMMTNSNLSLIRPRRSNKISIKVTRSWIRSQDLKAPKGTRLPLKILS